MFLGKGVRAGLIESKRNGNCVRGLFEAHVWDNPHHLYVLLYHHILNIYAACRALGGLPHNESTSISTISLQCMAYFDKLLHRGTIMDAREWDRIADLLMQIRQKYAKQETTSTDSADRLTHLVYTIDHILSMNDILANWDDKGWL